MMLKYNFRCSECGKNGSEYICIKCSEAYCLDCSDANFLICPCTNKTIIKRPKTQDGYPIKVGSHYWIKSDIEGRPPIKRRVAKVEECKVIFADYDILNPPIVAKLTSIFKDKTKAL